MSEFARIESIDALKNLRTYLCSFAQKISVAVDEADFDIQGTFQWLKQDRYPYWKNQERVRSEQLIRAKLELKRKKAMERAIGGHDSCIDEIKAVAVAQKRFDDAQEKFKKVQSWILQLEKDGFDCRAILQSLASFIRVDLVNYRTQVDQMIYALESYTNVSAPVPEPPVAAAQYPGDEVAKPAETADSHADELERLCTELRNRKPLESAPNIPAQAPLPDGLKKLAIADRIREILQKNKQEAFFVRQNEKLAFEEHIERLDFIYFEHLFAGENSEFTWYIGHVEPEKSRHISIGTVADFLKEYPALSEILSLPPGWMVLIKKNSVEAVFNADNKLAAQK